MTGYAHQYEYRMAPPGGRMTWAVQRIILLTTAVFVVQLIVHVFEPLATGGALPYAPPGLKLLHFFEFDSAEWPWNGFIWQPVTYMFLHGGLMHLFGNMLWLYVFGPDVERVLGTRQFVRFYLITGGLGVLATLLTAPFSLYGGNLVIGASGATMGVLVAFAVIDPDRELVMFPIPIRLTARALVLVVIAWNVVMSLGQGGVSVATHFGGLAVGYTYMKLVPRWRAFLRQRRGKNAAPPKDPMDAMGEAVDNIFSYEKEKRRRK